MQFEIFVPANEGELVIAVGTAFVHSTKNNSSVEACIRT